ncbi:hypothetical protein BBJ28_00012840, partial [Nothophytophthora sp. Chile5]
TESGETIETTETIEDTSAGADVTDVADVTEVTEVTEVWTSKPEETVAATETSETTEAVWEEVDEEASGSKKRTSKKHSRKSHHKHTPGVSSEEVVTVVGVAAASASLASVVLSGGDTAVADTLGEQASIARSAVSRSVLSKSEGKFGRIGDRSTETVSKTRTANTEDAASASTLSYKQAIVSGNQTSPVKATREQTSSSSSSSGIASKAGAQETKSDTTRERSTQRNRHDEGEDTTRGQQQRSEVKSSTTISKSASIFASPSINNAAATKTASSIAVHERVEGSGSENKGLKTVKTTTTVTRSGSGAAVTTTETTASLHEAELALRESTTAASGSSAESAEGDEARSGSSKKRFKKRSKKSRSKQTENEVEISSAVASAASEVVTEEKQNLRAAAAWGEETVSSRTVSMETTYKYMQILVLRRERSLTLAFEDLWCTVQTGEEAKVSTDVVRGAMGYAESGAMTAVLGGSRVSKAAFLGALAGQLDQSKGKVFYSGHEASALVRRRATGYCWYGDEHAVWHGTTTVREALSFSAHLRQSDEVNKSKKLEIVESCLELLELTELADQRVDLCSAEEMRLVAIGVELAFAPSVLLVDEPTNGLDAKGAQRIVRVLQQVAKTGRTVVCTLGESASAAELRSFDRLLLLSSNGETIFHGESRQFMQYMEALPGVKKLSGSQSLAAWAIESVGGGSTMTTTMTTTTTTITGKGGKARTSTKKKKYASGASTSMGTDTVSREKETRFVQFFQRSELKRTLLTQMQRVGYSRPSTAEEYVPALVTASKRGELAAYAASWGTQMTWLLRRVVLSYWRMVSSVSTIQSAMTMTSAITTQWQRAGVTGLFVLSFVWFLWLFSAARSTEYDTFEGVNYGAALIAWSTLMLGAVFALGAVARASRGNAWRENASWRREQACQAYPALAYHLSSGAVELLLTLVVTFVAVLATFSLFGFWSVAASGSFSLYWMTLAIFALGQLYLGQWLVRSVPSGSLAAAAGVGLNLLPLLLFVWSWRSSMLGNFLWLLMLLTPQRFALQTLQALVFGAAADSCLDDAEEEILCHELRLIPADESIYSQQQLTVHSYAELEYGAYRASVTFRLLELVLILVAVRYLVAMALNKRQARA